MYFGNLQLLEYQADEGHKIIISTILHSFPQPDFSFAVSEACFSGADYRGLYKESTMLTEKLFLYQMIILIILVALIIIKYGISTFIIIKYGSSS